MKPEKILYVDDEAIALKYFERLVGPLAPVLTAISVEEGRAVLGTHGSEIAVLVCDQRMPGERGNELLRHARQHYPHIVRMLTTAYSELGEAIDAINTGEIYRYIAKPWELESLRADLRNALELATLRHERDELMRDRMVAQQGQLVAARLGSLLVACAGVSETAYERALFRFARAAQAVGSREAAIDWNQWDHADLQQAEAQRSVAIAAQLRRWLQRWGAFTGEGPAQDVLAQALGGEHRPDGVLLRQTKGLTELLSAPAGQVVTAEDCLWLAWQLWTEGRFSVAGSAGAWRVAPAAADPLPVDWLADAMERLRG
ncbi:response regulator [Hydrogenophaga sp. MI9]|uniref:response regulator n=1 Tax=Hydrogenophaga sp. MI9 TaxID=3453719 RepID=UPI003EEFAEA5